MSRIDRDPAHLYPDFSKAVVAILEELTRWCSVHWPGHKAYLYEGFRTQARQQELYAQGRTVKADKDGNGLPIVTQKNGTTNPSQHQSCCGADVVGINAANEPTWDCPLGFWQYLEHLAHLHGLTSGSDWKTFTDQPHVEWPIADKATYAKARAWKKEQGLA